LVSHRSIDRKIAVVNQKFEEARGIADLAMNQRHLELQPKHSIVHPSWRKYRSSLFLAGVDLHRFVKIEWSL
jgi:hypothetical protein